MSPHDFRRIALAHDLLIRDSRKPLGRGERGRPDRAAAEPKQERIPAERGAQKSGS
jgi:hypothetical protein